VRYLGYCFFNESLYNKDTDSAGFRLFKPAWFFFFDFWTWSLSVSVFFLFSYLLCFLNHHYLGEILLDPTSISRIWFFVVKIVVEKCGKTVDVCQSLSQLQNNAFCTVRRVFDNFLQEKALNEHEGLLLKLYFQ